MKETILVIGATGMSGEPVAKSLKEDGFQIRIMTRDYNKAKNMFDNSFEFITGDVIDDSILDKSLNGCYGVHINLSGELKRIAAEKVGAAALKKGIERITYISETQPATEKYAQIYPQIKQEILAVKALQECGVSYFIFYPSWFMELLPRFIYKNTAFIVGKQPYPVHLVALDDYTKMVSASYKLKEPIKKELFIRGPEGILLYGALKKYCSVFHPEIKKVKIVPFWIYNFLATVTSNKKMKYASKVMTFFEKIGEGDDGDPTEADRLLGPPKTTLDEWLKHLKQKDK